MRSQIPWKNSDTPQGPPIHALFLNTQDTLRADLSVHVSLARALDRQAVRVSVATNAFESPGDSAQAAFGAIRDLTLLRVALGRPVSTQRGLKRAFALLVNLEAGPTLLRLAVWCRRQHVDVVHVTERPRDMALGLALARLAGCALIIHAHTTYYPHAQSRTAAVADWVLQQADGVVGVSRFTAQSYWNTGPVSLDRVYAVHNATDSAILNAHLDGHARTSTRQQLGIPIDAPVIGSVGRLMRGKDQVSLVTAFAKVKSTLPEARLVLAGAPADVSPDGQGDYRDYLVRQIRQLQLDQAVVFTGFLPHAEMPNLYAAFDIFAHPCIEEPFGLVIVEAMAAAVPVVGIRAGGVPEIVRDGIDGCLVPPGNPSALADAIVALFSDDARARRLASSGRTRVLASFTPEVQARSIAEVYRAVLANRYG
ncbi:MAG: glycosyltransferase family 4 protein [Chloroflexi bacterium]|nr:glycosyltransferase family 4 protein [Chloroflexota bacterium]